MEVLDFEIEKNKKIFIYIIEKENEKFSKDEIEKLKYFLKEKNIIFGTIDDILDEIIPFSLLKPLEGNLPIMFEVGIPGFVKGYLEDEIEKKKELLTDLKVELNETDRNSLKGQNLESWMDHVEDEVKELELNLHYKLRIQWIVKKIIELINNFYNQNQTIIHFAPKKYIPGLKKIFDDLDIPTKVIDLMQKKYFKQENVVVNNWKY